MAISTSVVGRLVDESFGAKGRRRQSSSSWKMGMLGGSIERLKLPEAGWRPEVEVS